MKLLLVVVVVVATLLAHSSPAAAKYQCYGDDGEPVAWWAVFKLPSHVGFDGMAYLYADVRDGLLLQSSRLLNVDPTAGALGKTVQQLYDADAASDGWLAYNDEFPNNHTYGPPIGHAKGVAVFDDDGGFWLVHSVPRFPFARAQHEAYTYPDYAARYGQTALCLTLSTPQLNAVGAALLDSHPGVFDSNMPSSLAGALPNVVAVLAGDFVERNNTVDEPVVAENGDSFRVFAKTLESAEEIWSAVVAARLRSSMFVESWMNGAHTNQMPTYCRPEHPFDVVNIRLLRTPAGVTYKETTDHSKWGISVLGETAQVCIGGVNRQFSQSKRGGMMVCFYSPSLWLSLNTMIVERDQCDDLPPSPSQPDRAAIDADAASLALRQHHRRRRRPLLAHQRVGRTL